MNSGIVLNLDFQDSDTTYIYDRSRYKNNATLTGTAKVEKGYRFNGSDKAVVTTASQIQVTASRITLMVWLKSSNTAEMAILDKCDDGDNPTLGYGLRTDASGNAIFTTNTDEYSSSKVITDGVPHFIYGVLDGTNKFIGVDDRAVTSKAYSTAITDSAKNLSVGCQVNPEIYFTGTIFFGRVYNRGLTLGQVMAVYNATKHLYRGD
jgi:hypothetical protein